MKYKKNILCLGADDVLAFLEGRRRTLRVPIRDPACCFTGKEIIVKTAGGSFQVFGIRENGKAYPKFICLTPAYKEGQVLQVKEPWKYYGKAAGYGEGFHIEKQIAFKADEYRNHVQKCVEWYAGKWMPPVSMPASVIRLSLEVESVDVERIQSMQHDGPLKEGIHFCCCPDGFTWKGETDRKSCYTTPMSAMKAYWDSKIPKKDRFVYGWDADPWVWVYTMRAVKKE